MYYDLKIPYTANQADLQQTLAFLAHLGYNVVALDHTYTGKVPPAVVNEIPSPLPCGVPGSLKIVRRCTLYISDPNQNHRLSSLAAAYDILALRPTSEAALQQVCHSLDCDIISLDLSQRFPFYFKSKTLSTALQRGIKLEICHAAGVQGDDGDMSRRNLISNATQLIRATRGRGIVISSEARNALACRGPADVMNLAILWGMAQDKAKEAVAQEPRHVVLQAELKRTSYRGVIKVINGGKQPSPKAEAKTVGTTSAQGQKRKAEQLDSKNEASTPPISNREKKRQAKKARMEGDKIKSFGHLPSEALPGGHQGEKTKG